MSYDVITLPKPPTDAQEETLIAIVRVIIAREQQYARLFRAATTTEQQYRQLGYLRAIQELKSKLEVAFNITIDAPNLHQEAIEETYPIHRHSFGGRR